MIYSCNDSSLPGVIPVNKALEFRVVLNDTVDMLGNFPCLLILFHEHTNF